MCVCVHTQDSSFNAVSQYTGTLIGNTMKIFAVCYRPGVSFRNPRLHFRKEQFGARFKYCYFNFF